MAKDEEENIERCLRSLAPYVDRYVLLDTGSTDQTLTIAVSTFEALGLPFTILHRPFDTFAASRTFLVKHAVREVDWVLMIDADCTVSGEPPVLPDDAEIGLVEYVSNGIVSQRALYLAGHVDWYYKSGQARDGRDLHEYVTADTPHGSRRIRGLLMEHHGVEGDQRSGEDDLAILQDVAAQFPNEPRWAFYVAQTLKGLGRAEEALAMYRECAIMGQLGDEWVWYCMYQAAVLARDPAALQAACQLRPQRAESWYALACLLAEAGRYDLALPIAAQAYSLAEPEDSLFINRAVYRWGAALEYIVCLGATGDFDSAQQICNTLLLDSDLPELARREVTQYLHQFSQIGAAAAR